MLDRGVEVVCTRAFDWTATDDPDAGIFQLAEFRDLAFRIRIGEDDQPEGRDRERVVDDVIEVRTRDRPFFLELSCKRPR